MNKKKIKDCKKKHKKHHFKVASFEVSKGRVSDMKYEIICNKCNLEYEVSKKFYEKSK